MARPHVVLIGTGLTALTAVRQILTRLPEVPLGVTILDKARLPGGRLTSRTYDSGVTLETGARVFQSSIGALESEFDTDVKVWESKGWVREVKGNRLRGVGEEKVGRGLRWWEGVGGLSKGLIGGLVQDIDRLGQGRVKWHYKTTVSEISWSTSSSDGSPTIMTRPHIDRSPISLLVHTAPIPQAAALLPGRLTKQTEYIKTFTLLLPSVDLPSAFPIYHRDPSTSITSISTGISQSGTESRGLVIQSTPEKLGFAYSREHTSDEMIKRALLRSVEQETLLPGEVIRQAEAAEGRQSQIKRWKYAQIESAVNWSEKGGPPQSGLKGITVLEGGRVVVAGDGTAGGYGGVEGAWRAGAGVADYIVQWLEQNKA